MLFNIILSQHFYKAFSPFNRKIDFSNMSNTYSKDGLNLKRNKKGIVLEETYKDGKRDGIRKVWNKNGVLVLEETYKDGKRDGLQKVWNDDGIIIYSLPYSNGKMHGKQKIYKNGIPLFKRIFENGKEISRKWYRTETVPTVPN